MCSSSEFLTGLYSSANAASRKSPPPQTVVAKALPHVASSTGQGGRLALHTELVQGGLVQLAADRHAIRELELGERRLRLAAELAVDRACVEAQSTQLLLNAAHEPGVGI